MNKFILEIKKAYGITIFIMHLISIPIAFLLILLLNNIYFFYLILNYYNLTIISWIIFGNCLVTPIENYLLDIKPVLYPDGSEVSMITINLEKITSIDKNYFNLFFTYLPVIISMIIFIRMYNLQKMTLSY